MAVFTVSKVANDNYALRWPGNKLTVLTKMVDFTVAANNLAVNGIMAIFKIPAKTHVVQFGMRVVTADTTVTRVNLGAYTEDPTTLAYTVIDDDGFCVGSGDSGATLAVAGYVAMDVNAAFNLQGASAGYVFAADSVLTVTNVDADSSTIDEAVVEFFAIVVDMSGYSSITPGGSGSYTT